MEVIYVSTEASPFLMVGGLANACYSMAESCEKLGINASIMMPLYKKIKESSAFKQFIFLGNRFVNIGTEQKYLGLFKTTYGNLTYYFIDNEEYFYHDMIYGHANDGERFTFFCEAVLESFKLIKDYPAILHLHDWPTGLIPYLLKSRYKYHLEYQKIKTVFTIYDLALEQGIFPIQMEEIIDAVNSPVLYLDGKINFTKAAISEADYITCASQTYRDTALKANNSLALYLNDHKKNFKGILYGFNDSFFNPETDPMLYHNFNSDNFITERYKNKEAFKNETGFLNTNCILVSIIGAHITETARKGVIETAEYLLNNTDAEVYVSFDIDNDDKNILTSLENNYPGRFKFQHCFDYHQATKVFASSDIVIHPYYNSPSTVSQMVSMHYGAVIITNESGSVKDIIKPYNHFTDTGNCFSFTNPNKNDFFKVFDLAYGLYRFNQTAWFKVVRSAMQEDFSSLNLQKELIKIYQNL